MKRSSERIDGYLVLAICAIAAGLIFAGAGLVRWRQRAAYERRAANLRAAHERVLAEAGELLARRDAGEGAPRTQSQFNTLLDSACKASRIDPGQVTGTSPSREELPGQDRVRVTYDVDIKAITMGQLADLFYNLKLQLPGARVRSISATAEPQQAGVHGVHFKISFAAAS